MLDIYKLHSNPEKLIQFDPKSKVVFDVLISLETMYADGDVWLFFEESDDSPKSKLQEILDQYPLLIPFFKKPILNLGKSDTYILVWYATKILKARWPEAEPFIKKDRYMWDEYIEEFE